MIEESVLKEVEKILGFSANMMMNGIKIEDANIDDESIKIYYSVPETYEEGLIEEVGDIEKRNKEIVQEYVVNILIELDKIDTQMLNEEDYDDMKNYIKYYCKTRTGEGWTEENVNEEKEKILSNMKKVTDKFLGYKEV